MAFGELEQDVAFIKLGPESWWKFSLSAQYFRAESLTEIEQDPVLSRLKELGQRSTPGQPEEYPTRRDEFPTFAYFCWVTGLQKKKHFKTLMAESFKYNIRSGAHRLLMFRNDGPVETQIDHASFAGLILSVHHGLEKHFDTFRDRYHLKSIVYGSPMLREPDDRQDAAGCCSQSDHIIILHFDTAEHLEGFSRSPELRIIRNQFYSGILKARGKDISRLSCQGEILEAIQRTGNRYMTIRDYTDRHELEQWIQLFRSEER